MMTPTDVRLRQAEAAALELGFVFDASARMWKGLEGAVVTEYAIVHGSSEPRRYFEAWLECARVLEQAAVDRTFRGMGAACDREIAGTAAPGEVGAATDRFLEAVKREGDRREAQVAALAGGEIRTWNRSLSAEEVRSMARAMVPAPAPPRYADGAHAWLRRAAAELEAGRRPELAAVLDELRLGVRGSRWRRAVRTAGLLVVLAAVGAVLAAGLWLFAPIGFAAGF